MTCLDCISTIHGCTDCVFGYVCSIFLFANFSIAERESQELCMAGVFLYENMLIIKIFSLSHLYIPAGSMKNLALFCGICMQRLLIFSRPLNHCMTILSVSFIKVILYYL